MSKKRIVDETLIADYYREMNTDVVFVRSLLNPFNFFRGLKKDKVIVSGSRYVRKLAAVLGVRNVNISNLQTKAEQYFAMKDAFLLLARKKIPVYYYNRIGMEKENFTYAKSAVNRMKKHLSFPVMYEDITAYESDLRELFGELYNKDYIKEIGRIPQVIQKGNSYRHEDYTSRYVNVIDGRRIVCEQPKRYSRTIHVYGRCGAFGYAVEDRYSLPSLIQQQLKQCGITDIRVVNHGLWGGADENLDHNFLNDSMGFKEGDIILFYRKHIDKRLLHHWEEVGVKYREITHEWHSFPESKWCFFDKPGHMNHLGYRNASEIITKDLIKDSFSCKEVDGRLYAAFKSEYLKAYLKKYNTSDFEKEIKEYTDSILLEYPLHSPQMVCGSIVMNCNPFTKGHRYLIEFAASKVERLYVFVVMEDKSFFRYDDRFEMVKLGTKDIGNVVVVPSGRFIISSLTFPEYFMKDYVKEKDFDVSMDVETFCKYIAPPLNIRKRFAGEEPLDPVTKNYNENMSRILPAYGMEFCEIPRLTLDGKHVINATEVRRLLKDKNYEGLKDYIPQSTLDILFQKYVN